jgi:hypothetical protein
LKKCPHSKQLATYDPKKRISEEQRMSGKKLVNWRSYELKRKYVKWWDRSVMGLVLVSDIGKGVDLAMVLRLNVKNCCECSARLVRRNA